MPILVDCPICSTKLELPEELLGKKVKCAKCGGMFESAQTASAPPASRVDGERVQSSPGSSPVPDVDHEKMPCPRCGERIYADASRCRFCGEDLESVEEDDRRWEQRRGIRRDSEPHRASLIQALGIMSIVCSVFVPCCGVMSVLFFIAGLSVGIPGWVMGQRDLRRMRMGEMDPRGRSGTRAGRTCAIVGVILNVVGIFLLVAIQLVIFLAVLPSMTPAPAGSGPAGGKAPGKFSFWPGGLRLHNYLPSPSASVR